MELREVWHSCLGVLLFCFSFSSPYVTCPFSCDDEYHLQSTVQLVQASRMCWCLQCGPEPLASPSSSAQRRDSLACLLKDCFSQWRSSRCWEEILMSRGLAASRSLTASCSLCKRPTKTKRVHAEDFRGSNLFLLHRKWPSLCLLCVATLSKLLWNVFSLIPTFLWTIQTLYSSIVQCSSTSTSLPVV